MLEKGKINAGEFQILAITFAIGSAILVLPAPLTAEAKQDAWISALLLTLSCLFFIFIFNQLASLYPAKTYVEYNEIIFGKWIGKIASLVYLFYIYITASGQVRDLGDFFTTQVLIDTPIQMLMTLFVFTSLIGVRLGIEVISRSALIFFPWIVLLLFILFVFLIPQIEVENILPVYETGMKPILKSAYSLLGMPLQLVIFLMVTPYVTDHQKMKKAFYKGGFIGAAVITIIVILSVLVLGPDTTARQSYPTYILGKKISIGEFIQRIEVIVAIIWIFSLYFKLTICYYALALGLAQVAGLRDYKILVYPLGILMITFSIFSFPDIVYLHQFITKVLTPYSLTICFILPLLLLGIGKMRKRDSSSKGSN